MKPLLLTDSTMPVSFCQAGIGCARAMAAYLGDRVHIVEDVHIELRRLSEDLPALGALLEGWPPNPIRKLDLDLKAEVATVIKARHVPGQHPDEDRGETATVLYAVRQRVSGEVFGVITDDGYGKTLARDRELELVTTPQLAIAIVRAGSLTEKDGRRVWQRCVSRRSWKQFDSALARAAG